MKKLLLLTAIITVTSACSYLPYSELTYSLKYDTFNDRGIYVSPFADNSREYEFIGSFSIEFHSGVKGEERGDYIIVSGGDPLYYQPHKISDIFTPNSNYMMNKFADLAETNGADAIFDFKCAKLEAAYPYSAYIISGVFAKRK